MKNAKFDSAKIRTSERQQDHVVPEPSGSAPTPAVVRLPPVHGRPLQLIHP